MDEEVRYEAVLTVSCIGYWNQFIKPIQAGLNIHEWKGCVDNVAHSVIHEWNPHMNSVSTLDLNK